MGNSYHGVAKCSRRKFLLQVFYSYIWAFSCISQAPESWSPSDLDIIGKIFFLLQNLNCYWVYLMPILVKGDDVIYWRHGSQCVNWTGISTINWLFIQDCSGIQARSYMYMKAKPFLSKHSLLKTLLLPFPLPTDIVMFKQPVNCK